MSIQTGPLGVIIIPVIRKFSSPGRFGIVRTSLMGARTEQLNTSKVKIFMMRLSDPVLDFYEFFLP